MISRPDRFAWCLGIASQQLTPELAESFGLDRSQGILIAQVTGGSPAAQAGLRQGDVIVAFRGEPATDVGAFRNRVSLTPPGSQEQLTVLRDGQRQDVAVTVGTLTEDKLAAAGPAQSADALGLTVQTLTPRLAEQFDAETGAGVVVTKVARGSVAARAGIEPGTVVLQVNRKTVTDAAQFKQAVEQGGNRVLLLLRKDGTQQFVALNW